MTKRLKYTKDILTHMLNANNKGPSTAQTNPVTGGDMRSTGYSSKRHETIDDGKGVPLASVRKPLNALSNN
jgi:hypothetical protein